jgi:hypothetical protein
LNAKIEVEWPQKSTESAKEGETEKSRPKESGLQLGIHPLPVSLCVLCDLSRPTPFFGMKSPFQHRRLGRPLHRSLNRRSTRIATRRIGGRGRGNHLREAVRAHRRLIRLAPEQFDFAVVARLEREREQRGRRDAELAAALDKVYGPQVGRGYAEPPKWAAMDTAHGQAPVETEGKTYRCGNENRCGNGVETVWFPRRTPRQERAIARWQVEWELGLALGREAMARHCQRQPHRRQGLGTLIRLIKVASALGRLSAGLETLTLSRPSSPPRSAATVGQDSIEPQSFSNPVGRGCAGPARN